MTDGFPRASNGLQSAYHYLTGTLFPVSFASILLQYQQATDRGGWLPTTSLITGAFIPAALSCVFPMFLTVCFYSLCKTIMSTKALIKV